MNAPKTAEGRARALAKRRDGERARSLGELKAKAERVAVYFRAFASRTGREEAREVGRIIDSAAHALSREKASAESIAALECIKLALIDVRHAPEPGSRLPERMVVEVGGPGLLRFPPPYDARYVEWSKARAEQNRPRAPAETAHAPRPKGPPPGWVRKLLDEAIAEGERGEPCEG